MNLVLIGYRGTGKSSVADRLGRSLHREVVSLDAEIVRAAGATIPEIVAAYGWSYFRDLEEKMCRRYGEHDGLVLDCGGGVVEREANFESLRRDGHVFWLTAAPAVIVERIGASSERPSLTNAKSFTAEVEEVLRRRLPLYRRLAHEEVETGGRSVEDIAAEIARRFSETLECEPPPGGARR